MLKKIALQSLIWKGKKLLGIRGFKRGQISFKKKK